MTKSFKIPLAHIFPASRSYLSPSTAAPQLQERGEEEKAPCRQPRQLCGAECLMGGSNPSSPEAPEAHQHLMN